MTDTVARHHQPCLWKGSIAAGAFRLDAIHEWLAGHWSRTDRPSIGALTES